MKYLLAFLALLLVAGAIGAGAEYIVAFLGTPKGAVTIFFTCLFIALSIMRRKKKRDGDIKIPILGVIVLSILAAIFASEFYFFVVNLLKRNPFLFTLTFSCILFLLFFSLNIYTKIRYKCWAFYYIKKKASEVIDKLEEEDKQEIHEEKEDIFLENNSINSSIYKFFDSKKSATELIKELEDIATSINNSSLDIRGLFNLKRKLVQKFDSLIRLEDRGVPMFPSPRDRKEEILKNWPNTINDFIDRSIINLEKKSSDDDLKESVNSFLSLLMDEKDIDFNLNNNSKSKIEMLKSAIVSEYSFKYIIDFDLCVFKCLQKRKIETSDIMLTMKRHTSYDIAKRVLDGMEQLGIISNKGYPKMSLEEYFKIRSDLPTLLENAVFEKERIEKERIECERKTSLLKEIGDVHDANYLGINEMDVILAIERKLSFKYQYFIQYSLSKEIGEKILNEFIDCCSSSKLPLAAEIRLETLLDEYRAKFLIENPMNAVDKMEGHEFENWCAELLKKNGFKDVEVTKGSGDQGVDVIAVKDSIRYAIQCKCYSSDLGNKPIQEVHAGKMMYHCQIGVVMTNRHFTPGAKQLAEATGVLLWDRDKLGEMLGG